MKRFWLGNDSAHPIELKISIDRGRGRGQHIRVLQDEIKIHGLGHLMDEAPSQGTSVNKFRLMEQQRRKEQEEEEAEEEREASSLSAASGTRDRDALGGSQCTSLEQPSPSKAQASLQAPGAGADLAASSLGAEKNGGLASPTRGLLEGGEAPATAPAPVIATPKSFGAPRPPKKDKGAGGGSGASGSASTAPPSRELSFAEIQERDYEVLAAVTWAQLVDPSKGKSSGSLSSGAGGTSSSSASLSSKGGAASHASSSASSSFGPLLSVSGICARQWGQEGVAVELCGALAAAEGALQLPAGEEGALACAFDPSIVSERRLFIGSTSKAVRKSRATKTFEKLYNLADEEEQGGEQDATEESAVLAVAAAAGDADGAQVPDKEEQQPQLVPDSEGSRALAATPLAPAVVVSEDAIAVREKSVETLQQKIAEPQPQKSKSSKEKQGALLQITLEAHERRQVTLTLCPSFQFIDEETGRAIDGKLLARSIPLLLEWRYCSSDAPAAQQPPLVPPELASLHWSVQFRACASLISVAPKGVYDLGLCSVGEYRTAILEVTNESELPALVFPAVPESSDVLDVAKAEREVYIAPREVVQVRVGYIARTEASEYVDSVALVNAYNVNDSKSVSLTARNVDTHQVLLHSMFY
jgi:hypothetical protein